MKQCKKCLEIKDLILFSTHISTKDRVRPECKCCEKIYKKIQYEKNKDRHLKQVKEWSKNNPESKKKSNKKWSDKNRIKVRESIRNWDKLNKPRKLAHTAKYRAAKIQSSLDYKKYEDQIIEIYKNCPKGYHVDHIIPLRGKEVRGLHVPWNLQYLPALENFKKGNRII